jgi:hypothetical protein
MKKKPNKALKPKQSQAIEKSELQLENAINHAIARLLPQINSTNFNEVVKSLSTKSKIHPLVISERIRLLQLVAE